MYAGDPFQIMHFEYMHNIELGLVQLLVAGIKPYADANLAGRGAGTNVLKELDVRLQRVPRYEGFTIPTGAYFNDGSGIQAKEHRAVLQVSMT